MEVFFHLGNFAEVSHKIKRFFIAFMALSAILGSVLWTFSQSFYSFDNFPQFPAISSSNSLAWCSRWYLNYVASNWYISRSFKIYISGLVHFIITFLLRQPWKVYIIDGAYLPFLIYFCCSTVSYGKVNCKPRQKKYVDHKKFIRNLEKGTEEFITAKDYWMEIIVENFFIARDVGQMG